MSARITAIKVKDVQAQTSGQYFNWTPDGWDVFPEVKAGHNVYVAFYGVNLTSAPVSLTFRMANTEDYSNHLAKKTVTVQPAAGDGLEWTGTMPNTPLGVKLEIFSMGVLWDTQILLVYQKIEAPPPEPEPTPTVSSPCLIAMIGVPKKGQVWLRKNVRAFMPRFAVKAYYAFSRFIYFHYYVS